jgi:hypothetical protein
MKQTPKMQKLPSGPGRTGHKEGAVGLSQKGPKTSTQCRRPGGGGIGGAARSQTATFHVGGMCEGGEGVEGFSGHRADSEPAYLLPLLPRVTHAVPVHVLADYHIWNLSLLYRDGDITQWTHGDMDILKRMNTR